MRTEKYDSLKQTLKTITRVVMWVIFVLLILVAFILAYYFIANHLYATKGDKYKPAFGLYTIVSPSMEPNLNIYDVIVDVNVNSPDDIKVGDVITFVSTSSISKGMTITHRVVSISDGPNGKQYKTKGDNNLTPDLAPAEYSNVLGKVILKIPQLGRLQSFLATRGGWLIVVVIPAIVIIIMDVLKLFRLQGAQNNIKAIAEKEAKEFQKTMEEKEEIKKNLEERYHVNRKTNEPDPLKKTSIIMKVDGKTSSIGKNSSTSINELPKFKENGMVKPKRIRVRKKKNKNQSLADNQ